MRWLEVACCVLVLGIARPSAGEPVVVDRVIARFLASELGGAASPRFIFERELAFEARLEALADPDHERTTAYRERHLTAALERYVAETLLSGLRIEPEPGAAELNRQADAARLSLLERSGGLAAVEQAARAEGISTREVRRLLRRRARASLYLDRMVAPMLRPSEAELRALHRSGQTPFRDAYPNIAERLRRWTVAQRLSAAAAAYFQAARTRVRLRWLGAPATAER